MLNSKILVGISLAVWNSFAAYQVARSTANGAMGDPKTYGYGLAFTTGLTALWIWSGIIKESEKTSGKIPRTMNSKLSPTLLAMEKAKWRSIIGMDFYTKGVWEMIQKEEAIAQKKGKQVSVAKIKKKAAAIEAARVKKIQEEMAIAEKNKKKSVSSPSTSTSKSAEDSPDKNKKNLDPDYVPPSPAFVTGSNLRFPRKITINYGMNQERSVDITVPADLKYDGIAEEGVIGAPSSEHPSKKVILGLAFLRETSQGTYYPFVLRVNGVGRDFKTAADALEYNLKFILNAQPWNDSGDIPIDINQDGTFDLIQDPAGKIKKPWWTTKEAENKLPEVPWNLEYVPNAKLSDDSWAISNMGALEKEIRQNKHTNQFMQVGCPVCGSVNEFFRNVSNNGIRYNCMDCMYTSGDHYVSLKSRGDKTLADFGMTTLCGVCGDTIHAYTNSQFQRHMDKHKSEKVSESETSSGKIMNSEDNVSAYEKTYGRAGARIRQKIKKDLMEENSFGTKSGQWSARKSQELKKRYEAAMKAKGLKPYRTSKKSKSQKDLSQWTKQDWTTASGNKSSRNGEPYFPAKAVAALKKAKLYKKAKAQKRRATASGKQYARYSPDIQAIVANYRGENIHEN